MIPKNQWLKEQQARVAKFRQDGWSQHEIDRAYEHAWILKVSYIDELMLKMAREELSNK